MTTSNLHGPQSELDALEFEYIDLGDAKHALDELPEGLRLAHTLVPGYWESLRRKVEPSDRALTGATIEWLLGLAPELRPAATCEYFPRIANALAARWDQPLERDRLLFSLLTDGRPARRGLPSSVRSEIEALRDAVQSHRPQ